MRWKQIAPPTQCGHMNCGKPVGDGEVQGPAGCSLQVMKMPDWWTCD